MLKELTPPATIDGVTSDEIIAQVERLVRNPLFTSSKRSSAFLKYVVDETLRGAAETLKERTIGVELYGRSPSYDTNLDHVVRTAALELRKRLAIYYGDAQHSAELRITIHPGSYIPRFQWPHEPTSGATSPDASGMSGSVAVHDLFRAPAEPLGHPEHQVILEHAGNPDSTSNRRPGAARLVVAALIFAVLTAAGFGCASYRRAHNPERLFWGQLLDTPGPVLIAVGTARDGLPRESAEVDGAPMVIPSPAAPRYIPYADALTTATVTGKLSAMGKKVEIRRSVETTFFDLKAMPAVLVGAFDNPWSLRLMRGLRFSPEVDDAAHSVYIRDARNPTSRAWQWKTSASPGVAGAYGSPLLHDYALISRIREPQTGRTVVQIAGLEPYGTQVAGEFVSDSEQLALLAHMVPLDASRNLQIVLETTVTDGTPGKPRIVAVAIE